jgi:hypothetical protein
MYFKKRGAQTQISIRRTAIISGITGETTHNRMCNYISRTVEMSAMKHASMHFALADSALQAKRLAHLGRFVGFRCGRCRPCLAECGTCAKCLHSSGSRPIVVSSGPTSPLRCSSIASENQARRAVGRSAMDGVLARSSWWQSLLLNELTRGQAYTYVA